MKYLGVDHGKKRVGVSISDDSCSLALPLEVLSGKDRHALIARMVEIVEELGVGVIVVGHPLTLSGESGSQARQAEDFARRLGYKLSSAAEVLLWDERLTSREVDRVRPDGRRRVAEDGTRDLMAAVLILQSFLNAKVKRNDLQ